MAPFCGCRLLCPTLFSLPWTWRAFSHVQQPAAPASSTTRRQAQSFAVSCQTDQHSGLAPHQALPALDGLAFHTWKAHHLSSSSSSSSPQQPQPANGLWSPIRNTGVSTALCAQSGLQPVGFGVRHLGTSTQGSFSEAATAAATEHDPTASSSSRSLIADREMSDMLKIAACIRRFRSRGHLVSQLDPLERTAGGPWLGPIGDSYSR
jgi:hypothetical protein